MNTIRRLAGPLLVVVLAAACTGGADPSPSAAPSATPPAATPPAATPGNGDGFVIPKPGQLDPRPVPMDGLSATVDGRRVIVTATWTSGVEPCYVLDTIIVDKDGSTYTITLREGHGPDDVACIEIAQQKATQVDLGELDPGTYAIVDGAGGAAAIEVVVS